MWPGVGGVRRCGQGGRIEGVTMEGMCGLTRGQSWFITGKSIKERVW